MDDPRQHERDPRQQERAGEDDAPDVPPDTSEHPSHEEKVGRGAEDPAKMADEDRYRKGPGW